MNPGLLFPLSGERLLFYWPPFYQQIMIIRRGNEGPGGFIAVVFSPLYDAIVNKVVLPATAAANMAPEPRSSSYETVRGEGEEVDPGRWACQSTARVALLFTNSLRALGQIVTGLEPPLKSKSCQIYVGLPITS